MILARIGELDCRIGCRGGDFAGQTLAARLDRLARNLLGPSLGQALAREGDADPAYYILPEVDVALAVHQSAADPAAVPDEAILRTWSDQLARAIAERLRGRSKRDGIVTFADEAAFIASFIGALLAGRAWDHWYYSALARYRETSTGATALAVLRGRHAVAGPALAALDACTLDRLLDVLEPTARQALWHILLEANGSIREELTQRAPEGRAEVASEHRSAANTPAPADAWPPLLTVAWGIAARLGLVVDGAPPRATLLGLSQRMPALLDGRDPASLSDGVLKALHLLAERGFVRPPGDPPPNQSELEAALAGLVWLDQSRLIEHLRTWRSGATGGSEPLAPRLRRLLDDPTANAWHPLLIVAWQIAARLGLVVDGAPPRATLLALSQRMPALCDWRDPASLSDGVLKALHLLAERGFVQPPGGPPPNQSELEAALAGLVWLDRIRLIGHLRTWRSGETDRRERLPPRLRSLLDDLAATVATFEGGPRAWRDPAGLKLLLLARLQARFSRWRAGELACRVVNQVVDVAAQTSTTGGRGAHVPGLGQPGQALVRQLAALLAAGEPSAPMTMHDVLPSACAGVLLLVRAIMDARLVQRLVANGAGSEAERQHVFRALACAFSGLGAAASGDPAIDWLAGADAGTAPDPPSAVILAEVACGLAFDLPTLASWFRTEVVALRFGEACLVADPEGYLWLPQGDPCALAAILKQLVRRHAPGGATVYLDPSIEDALEPSDSAIRIERSTPAITRERVREALAAFGMNPEEISYDHLALCALAAAVLRAWAYWLRGFERSSVPWLLTQLVRRSGWMRTTGGRTDVWLEPRPLDLVLRRAGYLDPLGLPAWLGGGVLQFRISQEDT